MRTRHVALAHGKYRTVMRRRPQLLKFHIHVEYKKGVLNTKSDALSRLRIFTPADLVDNMNIPFLTVGEIHGAAVSFVDDIKDDFLAIESAEPVPGSYLQNTLEKMSREQHVDPFCTQLRARLNGGSELHFAPTKLDT